MSKLLFAGHSRPWLMECPLTDSKGSASNQGVESAQMPQASLGIKQSLLSMGAYCLSPIDSRLCPWLMECPHRQGSSLGPGWGAGLVCNLLNGWSRASLRSYT